jgi:pimeloyl-ACP methyl ester carboxylesterase
MADTLPLILLPGLGADRRLFRFQAAAIQNVVAVDWIEPEPRETLAAYGKRIARAVDPGGPCFVGGCSLGGMVALEMTPHLDARACFLISSIRGPEELPLRYRPLAPLGRMVPGLTGKLAAATAQGASRVAARTMGRRIRPAMASLFEQFGSADPRFLWWGACAVPAWQPSVRPWPVPVRQIHGDRDPVLPARLTRPDVLVRGAGHLMVVTRAAEVSAFLRREMERLGGPTASRPPGSCGPG